MSRTAVKRGLHEKYHTNQRAFANKSERKAAVARSQSSERSAPKSWLVYPPTMYVPGNASKLTGLVTAGVRYTPAQRRALHHGGRV